MVCPRAHSFSCHHSPMCYIGTALMTKQKLREKSLSSDPATQTFRAQQLGRKPSPVPAPAPPLPLHFLPTHPLPGRAFFRQRKKTPGPSKVSFSESSFPSSAGFSLCFSGIFEAYWLENPQYSFYRRAGKEDSELRGGQEKHLRQVQDSPQI